jgi:PAS domain S-box-containing protein
LRTGNERPRVQWFAKSEQISRTLKAASDRFNDAEDKKTVDEMIKDHESTVKLFFDIVGNRESMRSGLVSAELSEEIENRLVTQLNMRLYDKVLHVNRLRESAGAHLLSSLMLAGWSIFFVIAVVAAAATVNSWTIGRTIINRIRLLRDGASIIGEGNLDHRIDIKGDDEFTDLSKAFNAMTVKLQASYLAREGEIAAHKITEGALKQNERELETIIENAPACVKLVAEDGTLLKMNRAGLKIIEADSPDQVQGKNIYRLVSPRHRPAFINLTREVFQGKAGTLEFEAVGLKGKALWLNTHGVPLYDNEGKITAVLGITVDVTERKRAEEDIKKLNADLSRNVHELE